MDEIAAMQSDLDRLKASDKPAPDSVAPRLAAYKETTAKLDTCASLLEMQKDAIEEGVAVLRQQALVLVMGGEGEEDVV